MKGKVNVCVMYGDGINCDNETVEAFRLAGAEPRKALIADIVDGTVDLEDHHILAFPGGFSAADYIGAGKFYAIKMRALMGKQVERFVEAQKLVIGICNGFQTMAKYPLVPSPGKEQMISVTYNESARFEDRWVHVKMNPKSPCVFTKEIDVMRLPCRHGEGRVETLDDGILRSLKRNNQIVAWYSNKEGVPAKGEYPANPNGSVEDIVGICDRTGRLFGWMPHPEAFLHFTNDPQWTREREGFKRNGEPMPEKGDGLKIFRNAVDYVREEF